MSQPLVLQIYDLTTLAFQGMIDEVEYLILRKSWSDIPNSELRLSKRMPILKTDTLLTINNDPLHPQVVVTVENEASLPYVTYTLMDAKGLMNRRIIENNHNTWRTVNLSTIMQQIVYSQVSNGGQTRPDPLRQFPNFSMEALDAFGDAIDFDEDWSQMGDTLSTLAKSNSYGNQLGWYFRLFSNSGDPTAPPWTNLQYIVRPPVDRTVKGNPNGVPFTPIVFSDNWGNITDSTYTEDTKSYQNLSYVGVNYKQVGYGAATGFGRSEFTLQSQQKTEAGMDGEAWSEVNKRVITQSMQVQALNVDYDSAYFGLGDLVTIQSGSLREDMTSFDAMVTEITITYEKGTYLVEATLGEKQTSIIHKIKNAIRDTRKDSSTATGWNTPTFENGWSNFGDTYYDAGFRGIANHGVSLRGAVKGGTVGWTVPIFNLPPYVRPAKDTIHHGFDINNAPVPIYVRANGDVCIGSGDNRFISLDSVQFHTNP